MALREILLALIATALVASIALAISMQSMLPANLATHFNLQGEPDGSMTKSGFTLFFMVLQFGMTGLFVGLGFLLPRLPASSMNLPNREVWLAAEHRETTFAYLQAWMFALALGSALFVLALGLWTVRANLQEDVRLGAGFWIVVGGYLAFVGIAVTALLRRFSRRPG